MALLRKYFWVLVILGMVFVSLVVSLIFLVINKCISRKAGRLQLSQLQESSDVRIKSNKYQATQPGSKTPPLPPRTQFLGAEAQSYENLAEDCDDQSEHDYEETTDQKLDCVQLQQNPVYNHPNVSSGVLDAQSYENLAEENDYEESVDPQQDYMEVEDEKESYLPPPPPPPLCDPDPNMACGGSLAQSYENLAEEHDYEESVDQQADYVKVENEDELLPHQKDNVSSTSTEDYDDIGESEEDYDDII